MLKNIFLITFLLLQIQSQIFRGCSLPLLFPNTEPPLFPTIDFTSSCEIFETCIASFSTTKEDCFGEFSDGQELFCSTCSDNIWRRRYCYDVIIENMKVARGLDDKEFNGSFMAFRAMMNLTVEQGANCVAKAFIEELSFDLCDNTDDEQKFFFFELSNEKFIIQDSNGFCLDFDDNFNDCDFNNDEQWFTVTLGDTGKNEVFIKNKDGLKFQNGEFVISVIEGLGGEENMYS